MNNVDLQKEVLEGRLTPREAMYCLARVVRKRPRRRRIPMPVKPVEIPKTPKVEKSVQDRMKWIHE